MNPLCIRPVLPTELREAVRLLALLNEATPIQVVAERLDTLLAEHSHYQLFGAYSAEKLVGLAGAWIATKIWCGRYLEIDNIIVDADHRSSGIGSQLIEHLVAHAQERGCVTVVLDSYSVNRASHRLYHRLGFEIYGFHFVKSIGDWKGDGQGISRA